MTEQLVKPPYETLPIREGLELRSLTVDDANALFNLTTENREYLAEYLPWAKEYITKTVDDSRAFIESVIKERQEGESYGFGIFLSGQLVGHTSLMHLKDGKTPEIGYWIAKSSSGQGLTSEAASTLTDFGFGTLKLDEILIRARPENAGSNRVAEKLGYTLSETAEDDGVLHNHWVKHSSLKLTV